MEADKSIAKKIKTMRGAGDAVIKQTPEDWSYKRKLI